MKIISDLALLLILGQSSLFSQNVGIGTTTPTRAKLEVHGAVGATSAIFGGDSTGVSMQKSFPGVGFNQYFDGLSSRYIGNGYAGVSWLNTSSGWWAFDVFPSGVANGIPAASTRAITISSNGNVGIAGGPPNSLLQLPNTLANRKTVLYESANNDHQYYGFGINSGTLRYQVDAPGAAHRFYAGNGTNSSTFLASISGNKKAMFGGQADGFRLGINSGDPTYSLEVVQANNKGIILVNPVLGYSSWESRVQEYGVNSTCLSLRYNENTLQGWFRPDTGGYSSVSDERKKKNIKTMEPIIDKVMKLRPARYQFRENNPNNLDAVGLIAQETKKIFPELVDVVNVPLDNTNKIPDHHGIDYSGLSVIAIKAIQDQQSQIEALRVEIELLKEQNKLMIQSFKNIK